jgi:hypothetical protein
MNDTVWTALVGAGGGVVAGAVSGAIVSLIAPWVNWGIEKRKILYAKQQVLINDWRALVKKIRHEYMARGPSSKNMLEGLEAQGAFSTLRPHLDDITLKALDTTDGKEAARLLLDHIHRLEKEWGLI